MSKTVLLVEDDRSLRQLLRRYLERAGQQVLCTPLGSEALEWLRLGDLDVVVLDLGLPDVDGDVVLRAAVAREVPVVVLTARAGVDQRIHGLEAGADDYVTKPFSPRELVLRVGAVLHRAVTPCHATDRRTSYGDGLLVIDDDRHEVHVDGELVALTPTEWGLLAALAASPGRVLTRYELVNRVRGYEFTGYERTVDSHVKNLRRKLHDGAGGTHLVDTVVGVGYRLAVARDA
ncbi:MAG: response regulator transcription factor [Actinomycetota bacterium]